MLKTVKIIIGFYASIGSDHPVFSSAISEESRSTFMASSFPVHFCSAALHGASGYTHQDAAPLRVLSRLLSSKYLHVEIREKGTYSTV